MSSPVVVTPEPRCDVCLRPLSRVGVLTPVRMVTGPPLWVCDECRPLGDPPSEGDILWSPWRVSGHGQV